MRKKIIYGLSLGIVSYFVYSMLKESQKTEDKPIKRLKEGDFHVLQNNREIQEEILALQKRMKEMKRKINECKKNLTTL